jgi:GINS complex subunit 1
MASKVTPKQPPAGRSPPTISPPLVSSASDALPYGRRAQQLLESLGRADWLPAYDEESLRVIAEECQELKANYDELLSSEDGEEPKVKATLTILQEGIYRNKRCALVYLHHRLSKIEELWWKTGSPTLGKEYSSKLSKAEIEHYDKFQKLMTKTKEAIDMDLSSNVVPPQDLLVEVRVLKDEGEVVLQSGARVLLQKNSTHFLRRSDVEHLILQNILEQVS